ncbi:hypothetical protein [Chryseobacterium scophthalmum]|uniref:hypothetical protein n=1 Tax=Chryseobacterium scophthalmum TaxID=59733 RepID=UPI001AEC681D|nr:hypothetical protein [Chryseobacterium scophthalmum]
MAKFIARINLDNFTKEISDKLLDRLQRLYVDSKIPDPITEELFNLPVFEYYYDGDIEDIKYFHQLMLEAIKPIQENPLVIVYKVEEYFFTGLRNF